MIRMLLVGCALVLAISIASAQSATLKMRFVLDGVPPAPQKVFPRGGPAVAIERLVVDPKSRGIKNVCVYAYDQLDGPPLDLDKAKPQKHSIRIQNGRFAPHLTICRVGDKLEVSNQEQGEHSVSLDFYANRKQRLTLPAGKSQAFTVNSMERGAAPVTDNMYPWMRSYVLVLTHSAAAKSGTDGSLTISDLPANSTVVFRCIHESVSQFSDIRVSGERQTWKRNLFEVSLKPGDNDLGEIRIPPEVFDLK